ncbi:MAG: CRISPR-associated RAMP protein Csx7 [Thermoguttaceae bacterium]|nr:CRISPR-associated RAMP protein Csx7 [Thermoguttaceae bacterium]MDW8078428.1 CRISPR-associated RAMP protein Csx7 [Thermoguttaceae bacterium]
MSTASHFVNNLRFRSKLRVDAELVFDTAWRIGSGREGPTSDLGVLVDPFGVPILPGSSIKGKLRSTCEALAPALGLTACLLNVAASGRECASDVKWFSRARESHKDATSRGPASLQEWVDKYTCDVCKLFGSPVRAAKIRCSDGKLVDPSVAIIQVRDGVVIDRDSHTAAEGLKYDFETVVAGVRYKVTFELEDPTPRDEALFGAALFEWAAGSTLGGFTSRGLGRFHLDDIDLRGVDFANPEEQRRYLTTVDPEKRWSPRGDWQEYFRQKIEECLLSRSS